MKSVREWEEREERRPRAPSIGERPAELAKRAVCGVGDGQSESLRPNRVFR